MISETVYESGEWKNRTDESDDDFYRLRLVRVGYRTLLEFLFMQERVPEQVAIPCLNLPKDVKVMSAFSEPFSRSFLLLVQHKSFDVVKDFEQPPDHGNGEPVLWNLYLLEKNPMCRQLLRAGTYTLDENGNMVPQDETVKGPVLGYYTPSKADPVEADRPFVQGE